MKAIKLFTTALLIGATAVAFAQKTKITKGDFKELKGQTEVNVVWDYSEAQARGGAPFAKWKAQPEQDWLQQIVDKKTKKKPEQEMTGKNVGRQLSLATLSQALKQKWPKCGKVLLLSEGWTTPSTLFASR